MTAVQLTGLTCIALLTGACATPQTISVETSPSGAAISVDNEYIGRSPAKIKMEDIDDIKELEVVAEKRYYETSVKTLEKKRNGKFPKKVFLKLEEEHVRIHGSSGSGHMQGGQQSTIQGPTIVYPGSGSTPHVSSPSAGGQ